MARYAVGCLDGAPRAKLAGRLPRRRPGGGGGSSDHQQQEQEHGAPPGTLLGGRLVARAFVTIATPHLACGSAHPEEVR